MFKDVLFDKLIGVWELKGTMGDQQLHHKVSVEWILQEKFLKMHTTEWDINKKDHGYESLYYIGWNNSKNKYVMHLIDNFGGDFSTILGFGICRENEICFTFDYDTGPFENIFFWNEQDGSWDMKLQFKDNKNNWKIFASKKMMKI